MEQIVPDSNLRELLTKPLESFVEKYPNDIDVQSGITVCLHAFEIYKTEVTGEIKVSFACVSTIGRDMPGSSRVMIFLHKKRPVDENGELLAITHTDVTLRVDVPFFIAFDKYALEKYTLYHIRFSVSDLDTRLTEKDCDPLFHGYIGITKRGYMTRFMEHYEKAKNNTGYLFHSVWHSLMQEGINMYPVIQINGTTETLKEIYFLEEELVREHTLTPMGLNAIPGGMAGIKMMHELRLLNSTKVGIDERDAALEALQQRTHAHGSPCAHYRRGHMRKLETGKLTFVKPCWVNLKSSEKVLEEA
jgi:hypothetical protein